MRLTPTTTSRPAFAARALRAFAALAVLAALAACKPPTPAGAAASGTIAAFSQQDVVVGTGAEAKKGDTVSVDYSGWLYDEKAADRHGTLFDASKQHGSEFEFEVGGGQVIRGWDEGVAGMREGGKRILMVPAEYGYGDRGAGGVIPPGASLVFEVELHTVKPAQ